ncbi:MAG: FeoA family protein [Gemmatimonadota bacterium]
MSRFRWRRRGQPLPLPGGSGPLSEWPPGDEAVVVEVSGTSVLAARLRELGLIPGARVRVLRGGCPLVVQVEEGRLAMRRRDAAAVRVRPPAGADGIGAQAMPAAAGA